MGIYIGEERWEQHANSPGRKFLREHMVFELKPHKHWNQNRVDEHCEIVVAHDLAVFL